MSTDLKTTIEGLRSLVRRAEAHVEHCDHYDGSRSDEEQIRVDELKAESRADITALTEAIALLESTGKDTEMLDWLDVKVEIIQFSKPVSCALRVWPETVREVITAAMQKEKVEK